MARERREVELGEHMRRARFEDYLDTEEESSPAVKLGKGRSEGVFEERDMDPGKKEEHGVRMRGTRAKGVVLGSDDEDGA